MNRERHATWNFFEGRSHVEHGTLRNESPTRFWFPCTENRSQYMLPPASLSDTDANLTAVVGKVRPKRLSVEFRYDISSCSCSGQDTRPRVVLLTSAGGTQRLAVATHGGRDLDGLNWLQLKHAQSNYSLNRKHRFQIYCNNFIIIKSRRLRWAEHVARMGEKMNAYRILVGEPEGKTPLGRPRRR
jgi:hypothetical protein